MLVTQLPQRLSELQSAIEQGLLAAEDALSQQLRKVEAAKGAFHHVVETYPKPTVRHGPLKGVGLSHKDIFNLTGRIPGFGNHVGQQSSEVTNAVVIDALQSAGAEILASVVMAPYACGATSQNPNFPHCINPINPELAVGGSSSGSAVAVASNMSYVSLGTDTSGSVRIPAATCGITGLKTTRGLISLEGVCPLAKTLDTVGILGRYAKDIELILEIIRQKPIVSKHSQYAVSYWLPEDGVSVEVQIAIKQFLGSCKVDQKINLVEFAELRNAADHVMAFEIHQQYQSKMNAENCPMGLKAVGKKAKHVSVEQYQSIISDQESKLVHFLEHYFANTDLIVLPCLGNSIPLWTEVEVGHPNFSKEKYLGLFHFMGFINLLGIPSISFPIGNDALGRPVSVQVIAKPFHENLLLQFAEDVERQLFAGNCYLSQK